MKTWGEIKNEALGLMFSNVNGSTKVPLSNADVQEYVINMADAANYAIRDLSAVVPLISFFDFAQGQENSPKPAGEINGRYWYAMPQLASDFIRFAEGTQEMYAVGVKTASYYLQVPTGYTGNVTIPYYAYAPTVTEETADDVLFDWHQECLDLIPLYMASRLYMEDDVQLATMYRNQYEAKKAELAERIDTSMSGNFVNTTGWY